MPGGVYGPAHAAVPVPMPGRPRRRGRWLSVLLAVAGVAALIGGGIGAGMELTRPATKAEIELAAEKELALRWRFLPAEKIFPASVENEGRQARRVGITRAADCAKAADGSAAKVLKDQGCRVIVRATYTENETHAFTVGVAVLPDEEAAEEAQKEIKSKKALRVAVFPGTAAERFGDEQRQSSDSQVAGPYIVLSATGFTDGRTSAKSIDMWRLDGLTDWVRGEVAVTLEKDVETCRIGRVAC